VLPTGLNAILTTFKDFTYEVNRICFFGAATVGVGSACFGLTAAGDLNTTAQSSMNFATSARTVGHVERIGLFYVILSYASRSSNSMQVGAYFSNGTRTAAEVSTAKSGLECVDGVDICG
jgi:hypothetical protein